MRLEPQRTTRLALAALRELASRDGFTKRADLASRCGTTVHLLPRVLAPLLRAGWVASSAGPHGGYRVTVTAALSLLDVVEVTEGPVNQNRCLLTGERCDARAPCEPHDAWDRAREDLRAAMAQIEVWEGRRP